MLDGQRPRPVHDRVVELNFDVRLAAVLRGQGFFQQCIGRLGSQLPNRSSFQNSTSRSTSASERYTPWIRIASPRRSACKACPRVRAASRRRPCPDRSRVRLRCHGERDAVGKFALMSPVTTSTEGRCVATTRWMPVARASWASRQMSFSTRTGPPSSGPPARR